MFIRELISNASDALEKLRYLTMRGEFVSDKDVPLEIHIAVDDNKKILTIQVRIITARSMCYTSLGCSMITINLACLMPSIKNLLKHLSLQKNDYWDERKLKKSL